MRLAHLSGLILAGLASVAAPLVAQAQDVKASAPTDLSVTVYRDPYRQAGGFDLNNLNGFALITETRRVVIPAGEHRLRFEGVADGIEAVSAIVTGLPSGVIEKNRDAALLSPSALVDAAADRDGRVLLARFNPATGVTTRVEGKIRSSAVVAWCSKRPTASRPCAAPACPKHSASTPPQPASPPSRRFPSSPAPTSRSRRSCSCPILRAVSTGRRTTPPTWAPPARRSISARG